MPSSKGSSRPRNGAHVPSGSCTANGFFTAEPLEKVILVTFKLFHYHYICKGDLWPVSFFKSLLNLLQYCFFFMFCFFGQESCGILVPRPGIKPTPPALQADSLPLDYQGSPRESLLLGVFILVNIPNLGFITRFVSFVIF